MGTANPGEGRNRGYDISAARTVVTPLRYVIVCMCLCLNVVIYECASIRILGCQYRNILVLVLDRPTVLLKDIHA